MKAIAGICAAILLLTGSYAYALTDDLSVSVGVRSWYNWYDPEANAFNEGYFKTESSSVFMIGPTLKAQYKNFYAGITYLLSTTDYEPVNGTASVSGVRVRAVSKVSRDDLDIVIGCMITPRFNVNIGYKGIYLDETDTASASPVSLQQKQKIDFNLAALGVGGNWPIAQSGIWYLNGNGLIGTFSDDATVTSNFSADISREKIEKTAWGGSAETGVAFGFLRDFSANLGFKYQYIKAGGIGSHFYGPTFGLDYRF